MCHKVATIIIAFWFVGTILPCPFCHAFQSNHRRHPSFRYGAIESPPMGHQYEDSSSTTIILNMVAQPKRKAPRKPLIFSPVKRKAPPKPVFLTHEREYLPILLCRSPNIGKHQTHILYVLSLCIHFYLSVHTGDFFRQVARLESMDSYVLVSTLTSSMSFGCLLGFAPSTATKALLHIQSTAFKYIYSYLCLTIPVVAGLSAIFGLYAAIIFSLTILYGKSALGAERDVEYDEFIRATARARVHGFRCFSLSLGIFALEAVLVLIERTFFRVLSMPVVGLTAFILYKLWQDWTLLIDSAEIIYQ